MTIAGTRHFLAEDKEQAETKFHQLMANPARQRVRRDCVVAIFDLYLAWAKQHRGEATYEWYKRFLQPFIETIPAVLTVDQLKPFHVQRWVDAAPTKSASTKRAKIGSVKRALHWAKQQGYIDSEPLGGLQKPAVGRREKVISDAEFALILSH